MTESTSAPGDRQSSTWDDTTSLQQPAPVIGREREFAMLRTRLDAASAGRGSFVLISGESGIGKTTLVQQLLGEAARRDTVILSAGCYDLSTTRPYGPWFDMIQQGTSVESLPSVPDLFSARDARQRTASQEELFAQVWTFLSGAAATRPLVLVIEDLHWSDRSSLDLLRFVARRVGDQPILLVATYRDDDLRHDNPLYQLLLHLIREAPAYRQTLTRLPPDALSRWVEAYCPLRASDHQRLTTWLADLAQGNPFFVRELLHALEMDGILQPASGYWVLGDLTHTQVPAMLEQVIEHRLAGLHDAARSLLSLAAVIGHVVLLDLWQAVSHATDATLTETIAAAIDRHLLMESERGSTFEFVHALTREVLYQNTIVIQRRAWHRQVAETLAATPLSEPSDVAFHFQQAGDRRQIEWLITAAERAQRLYAPHEVITYASQALTIGPAFGQQLPISTVRQRGLAYETIGDFDRAGHDYATVREQSVAHGDRVGEWQALIDLGSLWASRDYGKTGSYYQDALELSNSIDDPKIRAKSLNCIGNWSLNRNNPRDAVAIHQEALEIFDALEDQRGVAETLDLLGTAFTGAGDMRRSARILRRAIDWFQAHDERRTLVSSLSVLSAVHWASAGGHSVPVQVDLRTGNEIAEQAIRLATEIGSQADRAYALAVYAKLLVAQGDYARSYEIALTGLEQAREIGHREWLCHAEASLALLCSALHALENAITHCQRALESARTVGSEYWIRTITALFAGVLIQSGDLERASSLLRDRPEQHDAEPTLTSLRCAHARLSLLLAQGHGMEALEAADRLARISPGAGPGVWFPHVSLRRGQALALLGRFDEVVADLTVAKAGAERLGLRPLGWQVDLALGRAYQKLGKRPEANAAISKGRAMVRQLADDVPDQFRDGYLDWAESLFQDTRGADSRAGLSERELEVLTLVADGLTDAEVAQQLGLSPRTIHAHLRSIYTKFDVPSRTAAVRVAIDGGLV